MLQNKNNAVAVAVCILGEYLRVHVLQYVGVVMRKRKKFRTKAKYSKVGLAAGRVCLHLLFFPVILAGYAATRRHCNSRGDGDHQCCVSWVEMV
jgi:hypothetical protein